MSGSPRHSRIVRPGLALVAALALAAAVLPVHAATPEHVDGAAATTLALDARHAAQSPHLESSRLSRLHPCAVCLLQRQSVGVLDLPAPHGPPVAPPRPAAGAASPHADAAADAAHRPRAPPLA